MEVTPYKLVASPHTRGANAVQGPAIAQGTGRQSRPWSTVSYVIHGDAIGMSGMQLLRCWYCASPEPCPIPLCVADPFLRSIFNSCHPMTSEVCAHNAPDVARGRETIIGECEVPAERMLARACTCTCAC